MGERAEVVIVGGGVIGTSIAFHLATLGVTDVLLLERANLASGSTGRSVGIVETAFGTEVNVALATRGYDELSRFQEVTGETADFHPRPYLETIGDSRRLDDLERVRRIAASNGVHARILEPGEIREVFPEMRVDDLEGGVLVREAGFVDPTSVAVGYANAARRLGVRVRANAPVDRILTHGREVVGVRSAGRDIACRFVVNAAGPWCNDLLRPLGLELPVQVWQRQIFVTTPHPEIPADRPIFVDVTGRFYFRQELDGGFVLGLVEDVAAKELANPETDWAFRTRAVEAAVHRVPKLAETAIANAWSGNVTFTPDQLPIVGPVSSVAGLHLANGMSGYGVMISPAVGLAVAEMIALGRSKTLDVSALAVDRFREARQPVAGGLWPSSGEG
ncbi:MAG: NAD(P)/FAD-dependent oxidoreductase [Methanobacteriota archaeon]